MKILNLTQHKATPEQLQAGVYEPEDKKLVQEYLTFTSLPSVQDIKNQALNLACYARFIGATHAMIAGAPYLMSALENALKEFNIVPMYAFSERVSIDKTNDDGSVTKTAVFKHVGFVEV